MSTEKHEAAKLDDEYLLDRFITKTFYKPAIELASRQGIALEELENDVLPNLYIESKSDDNGVDNVFWFKAEWQPDLRYYVYQICHEEIASTDISELAQHTRDNLYNLLDEMDWDREDDPPRTFRRVVTSEYCVDESVPSIAKRIRGVGYINDTEVFSYGYSGDIDEHEPVECADLTADDIAAAIGEEHGGLLGLTEITDDDIVSIKEYLYRLGLPGGELVEQWGSL